MKYIQLHELISYPASNLNRDDVNRPKTVKIGDSTRLRISSQSLKRAWRTSNVFNSTFSEIGVRTNKLSENITDALVRGIAFSDYLLGNYVETRASVDKKVAKAYGLAIDECIRNGKSAKDADEDDEDDSKESKSKKSEDSKEKKKQLFHYSPSELKAVDELMKQISDGNQPVVSDIIAGGPFPVDIAMFGRMVASDKKYKCEAAVQVAHSYTVHKAVIDDDFFTAVDDLNNGDDMGAGHMGEIPFGAGLFYTYICVDFDLLTRNLGSEELALEAVKALVEASSTVTPTGKQNTFATRAYASYILVEVGDRQPRSLSPAFLNPIRGDDLLGNAISSIRETEEKFNMAYGKCYDSRYEVNVPEGTGSIEDLFKFLEE